MQSQNMGIPTDADRQRTSARRIARAFRNEEWLNNLRVGGVPLSELDRAGLEGVICAFAGKSNAVTGSTAPSAPTS